VDVGLDVCWLTQSVQCGMFAITCFLMKDWRNTPGSAEVLPYLDKVRPIITNPSPFPTATSLGLGMEGEMLMVGNLVLPCLRNRGSKPRCGEEDWRYRSRGGTIAMR
jgi:hypothetical protein